MGSRIKGCEPTKRIGLSNQTHTNQRSYPVKCFTKNFKVTSNQKAQVKHERSVIFHVATQVIPSSDRHTLSGLEKEMIFLMRLAGQLTQGR